MRMIITINDGLFEPLWQKLSSELPPWRENPKKAWTKAEKIAFVRGVIQFKMEELAKQ